MGLRGTDETVPGGIRGSDRFLPFDSAGRLQELTDLTASSDIISNATYGVAGQLLTMTGANGAPSETRSHNSLFQMKQLTVGSLNVQYNYSATQNNGKITSETDVASGETVTYAYDSLNRLASATSSVNPGWGQSYGYDGFGNLTTQTVTKGTAPSLSVSYDPATNRRTSECADANGNLCAGVYDVENRLVRNDGYLAWAYSYAPGNKRVWRGEWTIDGNFNYTQTTDEITYWSVSGQKLATYQLGTYGTNLVATQTGTNYYFGGKLVKNAGGYVTPDRLGSIGKYFPYGQERPSATTDGKEKFATYFRDSETGLDYADQRYHQPGMGRFMTPDPFDGSASANNPGSWNRYAYVGGDPVNLIDPSGTTPACPPGTHPGPNGDGCVTDPPQPLLMPLPGGIGGGMCYIYPTACGGPNFPTQAYLCMMPGAGCQDAAKMQSVAIELLRQVWNDCRNRIIKTVRQPFLVPYNFIEEHGAALIAGGATLGAIGFAVVGDTIGGEFTAGLATPVLAYIGAHVGAPATVETLHVLEGLLAVALAVPVPDFIVESQCGKRP